MKVRFTVKLDKPRNPVCLAAKQRRAGVHESEHPHRHARRLEKSKLRRMVREAKLSD